MSEIDSLIANKFHINLKTIKEILKGINISKITKFV